MISLEVEPLDLGEDVRAVGLELVEGMDHEPVRGENAVQVWSAALPALAGKEPWSLDFFGHVDRVRDFCQAKAIDYREVSKRLIVIAAPPADSMQSLLGRFASETFGIRAGSRLPMQDHALESELARRGLDAYQAAYSDYFLCGICDFENGSLVVLSKGLWATEIARRVRPALTKMEVRVKIAS
ncbi:MAG TPA: hypothetical protein VKS20_13925 [Candidatus Acidoferrales bacterium]|nr:hypothetical protein [Candidatus Acidoferrales bacterium]